MILIMVFESHPFYMKNIITNLIITLTIGLLISCEISGTNEILDSTNQDQTDCNNSCCNEGTLNLLKNGGLEEWNIFPLQYDMPQFWLCHNNNNVKCNYKIVYEGNFSAKMESHEKGSTARVNQVIPINPSSKIRIRFKFYIEQWKAKGARTYGYFRTESAEKYTIPTDYLKDFYNEENYRILRGGGYGLTYFPHELNIWQQFDETIEVPPTAKYFEFGINSYYGTIIYIDDCHITEIS